MQHDFKDSFIRNQFTFQYVSILIDSNLSSTDQAALFTFQYVSILMMKEQVAQTKQMDLHSNMFLF